MEEVEIRSYLESPLKKMAIEQLEDAISKGVSDLAGVKYEARIKQVHFEGPTGDNVHLELTLRQPIHFDFLKKSSTI